MDSDPYFSFHFSSYVNPGTRTFVKITMPEQHPPFVDKILISCRIEERDPLKKTDTDPQIWIPTKQKRIHIRYRIP